MAGAATGEPNEPRDDASSDMPLRRRRNDGDPPGQYIVYMSIRFIFLALVASMLLAFAVGRSARIILLEGPRRAFLQLRNESTLENGPDYHNTRQVGNGVLPLPSVPEGKDVPRTVYTSKNFDTAASATSSSLLIHREREPRVCSAGSTEQCAARGKYKDDNVQEEHLPAGQHLLIDMKGVDRDFLNSEERLANAILEAAAVGEFTLLSYHCHTLLPTGVSCIGVILESHISFHTWPNEGVITLDVFTCGSRPLIPLVPTIVRLFGVPQTPSYPGQVVEPPSILWSHKLRGFRTDDKSNPLQTYDLGRYILGIMDMDMKKEIVSLQTEYQRIDIYDLIYPRFRTLDSYRKSLTNDGSYESLHPEFFVPDRAIFLDGVLQSSRYGDEAYHEPLVHPAMIAHSNPQRVAIIGGGEGATLREVLKHRTVKEAIMIEIDETMVNVSQHYLPQWNDCSDLAGSADLCEDDPRAKIYYENALAWFVDRYYTNKSNAEPLDVIIMDALDPQDKVEFADELYNNVIFLKALYNALSDDGIIVMQLGESPFSFAPAEILTVHRNRAIITESLEEVGFESMHYYEEGHGGFHAVWSFLVAFKDSSTRKNWYANEAEVELSIHNRAMPTKSGQSPFRYFDGATMLTYQEPHKAFENVYCRREPIPEECNYLRGFNPYQPNSPASSFEVKKSDTGDDGRGVFAKVDIAKDSYMALDEEVDSLYFVSSTFGLLKRFEGDETKVFDQYMRGHGYQLNVKGEPEVAMKSGIMMFVNHGSNESFNVCSKKYNVGVGRSHSEGLTEVAANVDNARLSVCSPVVDRHLRQLVLASIFSRVVREGEEILRN